MAGKTVKIGDKFLRPVRMDELMPYLTPEAFARYASEAARRRKDGWRPRTGSTNEQTPGPETDKVEPNLGEDQV